jgi:hypothetical protein
MPNDAKGIEHGSNTLQTFGNKGAMRAMDLLKLQASLERAPVLSS